MINCRSDYYPDSLKEPIAEWLKEQGLPRHSYLFGDQQGEGNYVVFRRENDAVLFKMRWADEIEEDREKRAFKLNRSQTAFISSLSAVPQKSLSSKFAFSAKTTAALRTMHPSYGGPSKPPTVGDDQ